MNLEMLSANIVNLQRELGCKADGIVGLDTINTAHRLRTEHAKALSKIEELEGRVENLGRKLVEVEREKLLLKEAFERELSKFYSAVAPARAGGMAGIEEGPDLSHAAALPGRVG